MQEEETTRVTEEMWSSLLLFVVKERKKRGTASQERERILRARVRETCIERRRRLDEGL